jgi:GTPase SAR1 family protein
MPPSDCFNLSQPSQRSSKKVFVFGDCQCGKTAIVHMLIGQTQPQTSSSKQEECYWKYYFADKTPYQINIIDTVSYRSPLALQRIGTATDCVFVLEYAHEDIRSFNTVERLQTQIKSLRLKINVPPIIVVCNKVDCIASNSAPMSDTVASQELTVKMDWDVDFVPVSTKTGFGMGKLARLLLQCVFDMRIDIDDFCFEFVPNPSKWNKIMRWIRGNNHTLRKHYEFEVSYP